MINHLRYLTANLCFLWNSLLSTSGNSTSGVSEQKPIHTWSDHSLPVRDIHLTSGGVRCRVATCSLDQTCKVQLNFVNYIFISIK